SLVLLFALQPTHAQLLYADQIATGSTIDLPPDPSALASFDLGANLEAGSTVYVRIDLFGGTFGATPRIPNDVQLDNLDFGFAYNGMPVEGGNGSSFVILEIDANITISASTEVQLFHNTGQTPFSLTDVDSSGVLGMLYRLFGSRSDAENETNPTTIDEINYIQWVDGLDVGIDQPGTCLTNPRQGNLEFQPVPDALSESTCECGQYTLQIANTSGFRKGPPPPPLWKNGLEATIEDILNNSTMLIDGGNFDFIAGSGPSIGLFFGSVSCVENNTPGNILDPTTAIFGLQDNPQSFDLCMIADQATPIAPGIFNATFQPVAASADVEFDRGDRPLGPICALIEPTAVGTPDPDPLVVSEGGTDATIDFRLTAPPAANVTMAVSSSDSSEATLSVSTVTFTPTDWDQPHIVDVVGEDDFSIDGNASFTIETGPLVSTDDVFSGTDPDDVSGTNVDNEPPPGVFIETDPSPLVVTEGGASATLDFRLSAMPADDVVMPLTSSDTTEATLSEESVTFTPTDWDQPHVVTVLGEDDLLVDGDVAFLVLTGTLTSRDELFDGLNPNDVPGTNIDDETGAGVTIASDPDPLIVSENGTTATIDFRLTAMPSEDVTMEVTSDDPTEATTDPASVTFTPGDWDQPHVVTVTGEDDPDVDGDVGFLVVTGDLVSADEAFSGVVVADIVGVNLDDDSDAGVTVLPSTDPLDTSEFGDTSTLAISLDGMPDGPVVIALTVDDLTEAAVDPAELNFSPENFADPQEVRVRGLNDEEMDGDQDFHVQLAVASDDPAFDGLVVPDVAGVNRDDELQTVRRPEGVDDCDGFGSSVDISGNLITVGVPGLDTPECVARRKGAAPTGMVAIYTLEGSQPVLETMIEVPPGSSAQNFGATMVLEGDLLIIGAPGTPAQAKGGGANLQAGLWQRSQGQWNLKAPITGNAQGGTDDQFGSSIAFDGNVMAVGAPNDSEGEGEGSGAAYVYTLQGDTFIFENKLKPMAPQPGQQFGAAVAVGEGNVAVGSPSATVGSAITGSMTLYNELGGNLMPIGTVTGTGTQAGDQFGASMAFDGGLLAVGAPGTDMGAENAGATWSFSVFNADVSEIGPGFAPDPSAGAEFGADVDVALGQVLVGAPGAPAGGAAYEFIGGQFVGQFNGFGGQVALDAENLLLGAPEADGGAGAVMLMLDDPDRLFRGDFEN
ncbi:MAG: hypothetical protein AAGE01_08225, partial [Pseudomonadota bacterium]